MNDRGSQLLEAHIRRFDLGEPNARERLEAKLGEPLTRTLVLALRQTPLPPGRHVLAA